MTVHTVDYFPSFIRVVFTGDGRHVAANFYQIKDGKVDSLIEAVQSAFILVQTQSEGAQESDERLGIQKEPMRSLSSFPFGTQVKIVKSITVTATTRLSSSAFRWMTAVINFGSNPVIKDMAITDPRRYKRYSHGYLIDGPAAPESDVIIATVEYAAKKRFQCHKRREGLFFYFYDMAPKVPLSMGIISSLGVSILVDSVVEKANRSELGLPERGTILLSQLSLDLQDSLVRSIKTSATDKDGCREVSQSTVVVNSKGQVQSMTIRDVREYDYS